MDGFDMDEKLSKQIGWNDCVDVFDMSVDGRWSMWMIKMDRLYDCDGWLDVDGSKGNADRYYGCCRSVDDLDGWMND